MTTLSDLIRSSGLTVQAIAAQSSMSEKNLNGYISGKKDINNMILKDAIKLSSTLGVTAETLSQLEPPNMSHKTHSLDTNSRFSNFVACTNDYQTITCIKDDITSEDEGPTQQSGHRLRLPKNTTIGDYYLKAAFLRKYFTDDDVSIYRIIDSLKKRLSEINITEYDNDIKDIEEKLQKLKVAEKDSTPMLIAPAALFSRILYSRALHGDADKRQALKNLNLPNDLLHFAFIYEVGLRESILRETFVNLLDAHAKGYLDFKLPKNMLDANII